MYFASFDTGIKTYPKEYRANVTWLLRENGKRDGRALVRGILSAIFAKNIRKFRKTRVRSRGTCATWGWSRKQGRKWSNLGEEKFRIHFAPCDLGDACDPFFVPPWCVCVCVLSLLGSPFLPCRGNFPTSPLAWLSRLLPAIYVHVNILEKRQDCERAAQCQLDNITFGVLSLRDICDARHKTSEKIWNLSINVKFQTADMKLDKQFAYTIHIRDLYRFTE